MPRLSITACGLSILALVAAAPALAAAPTGSVSGQDLTNSVGGLTGGTGGLTGGSPQTNITDKLGGLPTDANAVDTSSAQNAPGALLPADELGGTTSGVPLLNGADPSKWNLKQGLGEPLVMAADIDLKAHGHPGGLQGQGVDPSQITEPLAFSGVLPQANAAMAQAGGAVPGMATGFTSLLGLGGQ